MPTDKEFQELSARVAAIERIPKINAVLNPGTWPRPMGFGEGTVSTGYRERDEFETAHPRSKKLIEAETAVAVAQTEFEIAQRAWIDASREPSGRFLHTDAWGSKTISDVPDDTLVQGKRDVPEYQTYDVAERRLIAAKVKMYQLQRSRDLDRQRWEQKRNPSPNPPKDEGKDSSWSSRVRIAAFGGEKRPASGLR